MAEKANVEKRRKGVRIPKKNVGIIFSCKNVTMRENGRMGNQHVRRQIAKSPRKKDVQLSRNSIKKTKVWNELRLAKHTENKKDVLESIYQLSSEKTKC